jgi:glyoxylase-like metal-dependent hydrolase (beta-lactamase superfamily II)
VQIQKVLAPNPGPFTGPGTNTYIIHDGLSAAVLDPGPIIADHEAAILEALGTLTPVAVIVTHNHPDHAPLANRLAERLQAASYGFAAGPDFSPDVALADGDRVEVGGSELIAVHTPGHTLDHLCFLAGSELFTGDHIMGGSSVIIEDAAAYFDSLYKVAALGVERLRPGHGETIDDAAAAVAAYIEHRIDRENQIIAAVAAGAATPEAIVASVYADVPPELMPAAAGQVEVQLRKLIAENRLSLSGPTSAITRMAGIRVATPD